MSMNGGEKFDILKMDKNRMKLSKKERSKTTMKETGRTDKIY
jgi:hypothetical protein